MDMNNDDQLKQAENRLSFEGEAAAIQSQPPQGTEVPPEVSGKAKKRKTPWVLFSVIFLILALVLGGYFGYRNGLARRLEKEQTTVVQVAAEQYQIAFEDIAAGNYENAKVTH